MPPPAVQVSMSLDMDFSQAGEEGSEERAQFKRDVAADVSSALGAPADIPSPVVGGHGGDRGGAGEGRRRLEDGRLKGVRVLLECVPSIRCVFLRGPSWANRESLRQGSYLPRSGISHG